MANMNKRDEPLTAPPVDQWFDLTLGSSFQDEPSSKFCTLRYEFKPASIDKNQPGKLHKTSDNKVTVEFQNNQPGKSKVSFEGSSEDYKDNDAVLFFDGTSFRLERLHRSVKRLRHVRQPGESVLPPDSSNTSPPLAAAASGKGPKFQSSNKTLLPLSQVEVEQIQIGNFKGFDGKTREEKVINNPSVPTSSSYASPDPKNDDDLDEQLDILNDDDDEEIDIGTSDIIETVLPERQTFTGIDINIPHQNETDDEIAEVDLSDDEGDKGINAADALRAQVERKEASSTSTSSSSSSSGSSSSSDSESSEGDSVNSI